QRLRRCRRPVHQLPVRMEGREVQRHVGAEIPHPSTLRFNFGGRVILPRNEQGCNLEPNLGLMLEVLEDLEYGSEFARAKIFVKTLGKAFEVGCWRRPCTERTRSVAPARYSPRLPPPS